MKILIIEDEQGLSDALCHTFALKKHIAISKNDGLSGLNEALTGIYDVIILDVMLPILDGFEILKRMRKNKISTPVLMLTAKTDLLSRVEGLNCGADYYLTKPFEMEELLACITAITRRPVTIINDDICYKDLVLKKKQNLIMSTLTNQSIKLSAKEQILLETLMINKNIIVSKERLIEKIWGFDNNSEYNNIEVYVSFVRKKINFIGSNVLIKSTRYIGYSLEGKND